MKYIIMLALVCLAAVSELALARHSNLQEWTQYKKQHGKVYETAEEDSRRFSLFMAVKERIRQHNFEKQTSYKLGLNHLSDWTPEERAKLIRIRYNPVKYMERLELSRDDTFLKAILDDQTPVPSEVDWRKVPNRVSPVKYQGNCNSGWAFATTGVLEGQQVTRNFSQKLTPLSDQELLDCSSGDNGCSGGSVDIALSDILRLGGIESEQDYPYMGNKSVCAFDRAKFVMTVSGSAELPWKDERILKEVVAKFGPVAIVMRVIESLFEYKSGVYADSYCTENFPHLNHGVLVVGYGTDPNEGDYWLVKNSFSASWGDEGYFKIKRGVNMCAMGYVSIIPRFSK